MSMYTLSNFVSLTKIKKKTVNLKEIGTGPSLIYIVVKARWCKHIEVFIESIVSKQDLSYCIFSKLSAIQLNLQNTHLVISSWYVQIPDDVLPIQGY